MSEIGRLPTIEEEIAYHEAEQERIDALVDREYPDDEVQLVPYRVTFSQSGVVWAEDESQVAEIVRDGAGQFMADAGIPVIKSVEDA